MKLRVKIILLMSLVLIIPTVITYRLFFNRAKTAYLNENRKGYMDVEILVTEDIYKEGLIDEFTDCYNRLGDYHNGLPSFALYDKEFHLIDTYTQYQYSKKNLTRDSSISCYAADQGEVKEDENKIAHPYVVSYYLNIPKEMETQVINTLLEEKTSYIEFSGELTHSEDYLYEKNEYFEVDYLKIANRILLNQNDLDNQTVHQAYVFSGISQDLLLSNNGSAVAYNSVDGISINSPLDVKINLVDIEKILSTFHSKNDLSSKYLKEFYLFNNEYTPSTYEVKNNQGDLQGYLLLISEVKNPVQYAHSKVKADYGIIFINYLIFLSVFTFIISRMITKPIKSIQEQTTKIANGNFDMVLAEKGNDEIAELSRNINQMSGKLKQTIEQLNNEIERVKNLNHLQTEFTANFTHEIKTPLGIINGFAELLDLEKDEDKKKEYTHIILQEVERINHLIYAMLDLSKLKSGKAPLNIEKCDLNQIVYQTLEAFEFHLQKKGIHLKAEIEEVSIQADIFKIEMVIRNLLSNSIKYCYENKTIKIRVNQKEFSIENVGERIPEENINAIWETFYKVDTSRNEEGTGLGLAICKSILELHGFEYGVENTMHGVRFYFHY